MRGRGYKNQMPRWILAFLTLTTMLSAEPPHVNTFSIVAFDPKTGEFGVAVESKYFGVGTVVPWAKAGGGAVATQAMGKLSYGFDGLELMAEGKTAQAALDALTAADKGSAGRQVAMIDAKGNVAAFTGTECLHWAGHRKGENYSVQGNLLTGEEVVTAMAKAFESARASGQGGLAEWMMAALQAGQAAGGDRRGQQSAALLVVRKDGGPNGETDRSIDLRVEDHKAPIDELERLLKMHRDFYGAPTSK